MSKFDREYFLLKSKVVLFIAEIKEILADDFPYGDSRVAANTLLARAEKLSTLIDQFPKLKGDTRANIALDVHKLISRSSYALGIIARSGTNRNAFEMYEPFRGLASQFFGDGPVSLILSSEWSFIPFTLPMTLEELPRFIVIGLPASESDNILMFPTAAHELGHSIWRQNLLIQELSMPLRVAIEDALTKDKLILTSAFPNTTREEFETDLFGKRLRDSFSNLVFNQAARQIEEIFCDFMGLGVFGRSYLHAFEYIIAPGIPTRNTAEYPETRERAKILNSEAARKKCDIEQYEMSFNAAKNLSPLLNPQAVELSDRIRTDFLPKISEWADVILSKANVSPPNEQQVTDIKRFFKGGIPVGNAASIGGVVSAAWETMLDDGYSHLDGSIEKKIRHLTDLVLKSIEVSEFRKWCIGDARKV